jgi:2-keto-4-pentenoate hydratase/2-oxohepta-3-ene-1,7-dioic acid hydratase in catechol pathway
MRLVLYRLNTLPVDSLLTVGALCSDGDNVCNLSEALVSAGLTSSPISSMRIFLELGEPALACARAAVANNAHAVPLSSVTLRAPIYDPEKVLCVGMNYADQ